MLKRLICLCLLLTCMVSCVQAEAVLAATKIKLGETKEENTFQSFHDWSEGAATTNDRIYDSAGREIQYLTYYAKIDIMEAYIEYLQNNGFTLAGYFEQGKFVSWKLDYDGASFEKIVSPTYKGENCHLCIYSQSRGEYTFKYTTDLKMKDLGARISGNNVAVGAYGPSADAALIQYGEDTFETHDRRLKVKIGEAMVIRGGETYMGTAKRHLNKSEWLWVGDYYRNEEIYFCHDAGYMMQGDIFELDDFLTASTAYTNESQSRIFADGHGGNPFFLTSCDGGLHGPTIRNTNKYESVFVRVMYYEKDVAAVYYVYAKMKDGVEPGDIEALCAVSLKPEEKKQSTTIKTGSSVSDWTCGSCGGSGRCRSCGGSGSVSTWLAGTTEYVRQDCNFCMGGRCTSCGGDGKY